jgi:opacity protein-like surface antigen
MNSRNSILSIQKTAGALMLVCMVSAGPAHAAEWSGFYAGITLASQTMQADWTTLAVLDPVGCECVALSDPDHSFKGSETGATALVGYNWNLGNWIVGAEVSQESIEYDYSIDDRIPGLLNDPPSSPSSSVQVGIENDGPSLRLRAGYLANPDLLLYVVAGTAGLKTQVIATCPADPNVCLEPNSASNSKSLSTTALGFGLERAVNRFLIRAEYMDADFGDFSFVALPDKFLSFGAEAKLKLDAEVIRLGVSYEF